MRVGIVGAGITGLAATHYLRQRGVEVVTLEATDRAGGVIRSDRVEGRVLEYGPQRVRLTAELGTLISDLDLEDDVLIADEHLPLYVYGDGTLRRVPRSIPEFLRTDALSRRGKLRVLLEPFTADAHPGAFAGPLLERKFGREAYRSIIDPLLSGVYAADPAEMPADHALDPLLRAEARHGSLLRAAMHRAWNGADRSPPISFREGLETLPRVLAATHQDAIRFNEPVGRIREGAGGEGFEILLASDELHVDAVVLTVPARTAWALLSGLRGAHVDPINALTYSPIVIVHLLADIAADGFGYQVRRDADLHTRGVTWNQSLFDREGVFTAFLGGNADRRILDWKTDRLARTAQTEFAAVMDAPADVLDVTVLQSAIPAYDRSWTGLSSLEFPEGITLATNYTGRVGVTGRLREASRVADRLATGATRRPHGVSGGKQL